MKTLVGALVPVAMLFAISRLGTGLGTDPLEVTDVYVSCSCQVPLSANLCLVMKEKVRHSSNLRLVGGERQTAGVAIHLVCTEAGRASVRTTGTDAVAAVVLTVFAGDEEYYESLEIMRVEPGQGETLADSILSQVVDVAARNFGKPLTPNE
jgi:hypothetical protein